MDTMLISEFARWTGISVSTLRHWHDQGLLLPAEVREGSGYRYYHAQQGHQARFIHWLRIAGMNIPRIRRILDAQHWDELQDVLSVSAKEFHSSARRNAVVAQTFDVLLQFLNALPEDILETNWVASLPTLPVERLSVAFVGIRGGIGRTPAAISTASMLHALGRDVAVVEVSPCRVGALDWAHVASGCGDPLPYRVVSLEELHVLPPHVDLIFDSSSRRQDFLIAAMLADKVVLLARPGECLNHSLRSELPLLAAAGVDVHGADFGVMVTGMPMEETILNMESGPSDSPGWQQEEWNAWETLLGTCLADLDCRGFPILGVIPERETHRLAAFTAPREFRDHHQALGRFLGIQQRVPPEPPADYLDQLRRRHDAMFTQMIRCP